MSCLSQSRFLLETLEPLQELGKADLLQVLNELYMEITRSTSASAHGTSCRPSAVLDIMFSPKGREDLLKSGDSNRFPSRFHGDVRCFMMFPGPSRPPTSSNSLLKSTSNFGKSPWQRFFTASSEIEAESSGLTWTKSFVPSAFEGPESSSTQDRLNMSSIQS